VDLVNFIKVKAILAKEFHIQPSEFDNMPAWEYEIFMKEINNAVKEENERNKREEGENSSLQEARKMANMSSMEKMQKQMTPKMPNITIPKMV
jgi:hypothetical protein